MGAQHTVTYMLAAVLWTGAVVLGVVGTLLLDPRLMFWSGMLGLVATILTGHLIVCAAVRRERIRVERLVEGLIAGARERADADLPRLR